MDRVIKCKICGNEFTFTEGEEQFYQDRNLSKPPKRCPNCRSKKKYDSQEAEISRLKARIIELEKKE